MKKGMIKVCVLYPTGDGKTFDWEYYMSHHVPLVSETLGNTLKETSYEKGIGGGSPGSPAPFVAMANLYFDTVDSFQQAFGGAAPTLMGDLSNFTNIIPVMQVSEVM